jgi:hypothetical protein
VKLSSCFISNPTLACYDLNLFFAILSSTAMVSAAPATPLFFPSSRTREQITAAAICCLIYEENIITNLCAGHQRAIPKLALSERARITNAFFVAWGVLLGSPFDTYKEHVSRLSPKNVICVRELAVFVYNNLCDEQHEEIARLMGYGEDATGADLRETWIELLVATREYYEAVGMPGFWQPDGSPLGLGLLIDNYQKDYVDYQVDEYQYQYQRCKKRKRRGKRLMKRKTKESRAVWSKAQCQGKEGEETRMMTRGWFGRIPSPL